MLNQNAYDYSTFVHILMLTKSQIDVDICSIRMLMLTYELTYLCL